MDSGLDKTRRNLLVSVTVTAVYELAGLKWNSASNGFFNFTVENPEVLGYLLYFSVAYFWLRYVSYYVQEGEGWQRIRNSFDYRLGQVAEKVFFKKHPSRQLYKKVNVTHPKDGLRIDIGHSKAFVGGPVETFVTSRGLNKESAFFWKVVTISLVSFPFCHSQLAEKEMPLLSPLVLAVLHWFDFV